MDGFLTMDRPLHGRIRTTDDKNFHPMNGRGRWTKTYRQTSWTYSEDGPLKIKECGQMDHSGGLVWTVKLPDVLRVQFMIK